jgi:hypothetical protein
MERLPVDEYATSSTRPTLYPCVECPPVQPWDHLPKQD